MSNVDILIHVHPELSPQDRAKLVQAVVDCVGVVSAKFDQHKHPHAMTVQYKPSAVPSGKILEVARQFDPAATLIGL